MPGEKVNAEGIVEPNHWYVSI